MGAARLESRHERRRRAARAGKVAGRFALEHNPAAERRQARSELTLGALWAKYRAHYLRRGGASVRTLDTQWRVYFKPWEGKRLSEISYEQARKLRDRPPVGRPKV